MDSSQQQAAPAAYYPGAMTPQFPASNTPNQNLAALYTTAQNNMTNLPFAGSDPNAGQYALGALNQYSNAAVNQAKQDNYFANHPYLNMAKDAALMAALKFAVPHSTVSPLALAGMGAAFGYGANKVTGAAYAQQSALARQQNQQTVDNALRQAQPYYNMQSVNQVTGANLTQPVTAPGPLYGMRTPSAANTQYNTVMGAVTNPITPNPVNPGGQQQNPPASNTQPPGPQTVPMQNMQGQPVLQGGLVQQQMNQMQPQQPITPSQTYQPFDPNGAKLIPGTTVNETIAQARQANDDALKNYYAQQKLPGEINKTNAETGNLQSQTRYRNGPETQKAVAESKKVYADMVNDKAKLNIERQRLAIYARAVAKMGGGNASMATLLQGAYKNGYITPEIYNAALVNKDVAALLMMKDAKHFPGLAGQGADVVKVIQAHGGQAQQDSTSGGPQIPTGLDQPAP